MSEKKSNVISLCEYRKKREAESRPFFRAGIKPVLHVCSSVAL